MTPEARALLQRIGAELDGLRQVRVRTGGIVVLDTAPVVDAREYNNGKRQRQARPAAGSRSRPPGRQGPPRRLRSPGPAPQVRGIDLRAHYEAQVVELQSAYPSACVVGSNARGMWLQVESAVLDGIGRTATFLVAVSYSADQFPRAWGFWNLAQGAKWIGPRHTNFTDGSVCAFVPGSGIWRPGGRLDALIDLYSVWALRQLHLGEFGRWPGGQFSPHPFYSLIEFKANEFCSCDHEPPRHYGDCCRPEHMKQPLHSLKTDFEAKMRCRLTDRNPPQRVLDFVKRGMGLPPIADVFAVPALINR
jgi:hypothetical protein